MEEHKIYKNLDSFLDAWEKGSTESGTHISRKYTFHGATLAFHGIAQFHFCRDRKALIRILSPREEIGYRFLHTMGCRRLRLRILSNSNCFKRISFFPNQYIKPLECDNVFGMIVSDLDRELDHRFNVIMQKYEDLKDNSLLMSLSTYIAYLELKIDEMIRLKHVLGVDIKTKLTNEQSSKIEGIKLMISVLGEGVS
jgi:hypothetical protein